MCDVKCINPACWMDVSSAVSLSGKVHVACVTSSFAALRARCVKRCAPNEGNGCHASLLTQWRLTYVHVRIQRTTLAARSRLHDGAAVPRSLVSRRAEGSRATPSRGRFRFRRRDTRRPGRPSPAAANPASSLIHTEIRSEPRLCVVGEPHRALGCRAVQHNILGQKLGYRA